MESGWGYQCQGNKMLNNGLGLVNHLWVEFGFEKFPLKIPTFSIFSLCQVKKISSGQVKLRQVGLLFTVGQNYARGWVRAHL